MGLSLGKTLILLVILYIVLATPWYIPKGVHPQILGLPLWALLTIFIILILGYIIYFISGKIEKVVSSG